MDFCEYKSLSIMNTMLKDEGLCLQYKMGHKSMIHFLIVSSDLWVYILDIWAKRGAESF